LIEDIVRVDVVEGVDWLTEFKILVREEIEVLCFAEEGREVKAVLVGVGAEAGLIAGGRTTQDNTSHRVLTAAAGEQTAAKRKSFMTKVGNDCGGVWGDALVRL
jgi:hypothetical protein